MLPVLIIGAGPFGLAVAGHLRRAGIEHAIFGRLMGFWREHMPPGMVLRSGCGWHYDTADMATINGYLATLGTTPTATEPLSLATYLGYAEWFAQQLGLDIVDEHVISLDRVAGGFSATTASGAVVTARNVVLALGFGTYANVPEDLAALIPARRRRHTIDAIDLERHRGRRVFIVGGRQSAFEWAALVREEGAASVDLAYRHDTPSFAPADWSWFEQKVVEMAADPGWFRRLSQAERDAVNRRFWEEGRLKLEPWLAPRIAFDNVRLWPRDEVVACTEVAGSLSLTLRQGARIEVDDVIFATGYRVDFRKEAFLQAGNLLPLLEVTDGYPRLTTNLATSIPGLYVTSMPAVRDFGLFFAFTISARTSARLIGNAIATGSGGAVR